MAYNKRGGIRSQRKGAQFENFITNILNYLKNSQKAWITKKDTPVGYQKINGKLELFYKKKSTVDFEGFLRGGRHVCFECKHTTNSGKYTFNRPHQIEYLYQSWLQGCLAFLLIYTGENFYKFIPDNSWKNKASLTVHFEAGIKISYDKVYDFLEIN